MILALVFFGSDCSSQDQGPAGLKDRQPAVAGQFYAGSQQQLRSDLADLFSSAEPKKVENVLAVISPHAGYVFSGEVAASAFNQIDPEKNYENVFLLASSHRMYFDGASIYNKGNYETPLGKVKVNLELANKLIHENKVFSDRDDAHLNEHSLEVQLPFLQYKLGNDFRIVPIILGTQSAATCEKIAEALEPYLNDRNLFVISTDFSHYPSYEDAMEADGRTAGAILSNSVDSLKNTLAENDDMEIPNLATSLCGWTSVMSLLYMTQGHDEMVYKPVRYRNSGDARLYGDKDRVVGYYSIVLTQDKKAGKPEFSLTEKEKRDLLGIARTTVEEYVENHQTPTLDESKLTSTMKTPCGAFVTLHKEGQLRGCIGRFDAEEPLYRVVESMAIAAATRDHRFPPVSPDELEEIDIEISVLTPLRLIESIEEIELGRHGIYIKKGYSSGTFLPQVATETGWTREEFLGHCARDKARIGWDGWKDAEIYVYEALVFDEKDLK